MWTEQASHTHDRRTPRYPGDLTDAEWALLEPEVPPARRGGRPRSTDMREVFNALLYLLNTGCQWRFLPKEFPPKSTAHGYLRTIGWVGRNRRLARDVESLCASAVALIELAMIQILLRRLTKPYCQAQYDRDRPARPLAQGHL